MALSKNQVKKVLTILEKEYGQSTTALEYKSPFQLLISTILSAQSTDKQVNKITRDLFRDHPDVRSFLNLPLEELESKIKSIGLYRSKAKNILQTCRILHENYNGRVPESREALMTLPGVGRKTANVVLSVGFNQDAIAVDTHVFRVANRIGLAQAADVSETEKQLMEKIPQQKWSAAHHWLIWHGRIVCKAQKPRCTICPISPLCRYFQRSETARSSNS